MTYREPGSREYTGKTRNCEQHPRRPQKLQSMRHVFGVFSYSVCLLLVRCTKHLGDVFALHTTSLASGPGGARIMHAYSICFNVSQAILIRRGTLMAEGLELLTEQTEQPAYTPGRWNQMGSLCRVQQSTSEYPPSRRRTHINSQLLTRNLYGQTCERNREMRRLCACLSVDETHRLTWHVARTNGRPERTTANKPGRGGSGSAARRRRGEDGAFSKADFSRNTGEVTETDRGRGSGIMLCG